MYSIHRNADKPIPDLLADEIQDDRNDFRTNHKIFDALREYAHQIGMADDAEIFATYAEAFKL